MEVERAGMSNVQSATADNRPPVQFGVFQQLSIAAVSRYLALQGWDWLILDMEHGSFDYQTAYECCHVIRGGGSKPLVRVPVGGFSAVERVLDLGAMGVAVPMVNSREEAEHAAKRQNIPRWGAF